MACSMFQIRAGMSLGTGSGGMAGTDSGSTAPVQRQPRVRALPRRRRPASSRRRSRAAWTTARSAASRRHPPSRRRRWCHRLVRPCRVSSRERRGSSCRRPCRRSSRCRRWRQVTSRDPWLLVTLRWSLRLSSTGSASPSTTSSRPDPTVLSGLVSVSLFGCEPPSSERSSPRASTCVALVVDPSSAAVSAFGDADTVRHGRPYAERDGARAQPGVPLDPGLRPGAMFALLAVSSMRGRMSSHS